MQFVTWTNPFMHLRDNPRLSTNEGFLSGDIYPF